MKKAIFYYLFSSISLLGDSVFLYFLSLNLLNFKHGGILSGIVLGIDSFFQIVLGPYLARFVDAVPQLQKRISISLWLQGILIIISFLPGFLTSYNLTTFALLTLLFAFMRFLSLIDTQLKAALPLYFEQKKIFPLVRSLSFSNFSLRCIHVVSTSLAPLLISFSWLSICSLNSFSFLFSLIGVYFVFNILNQDINQESNMASKKNTSNSLSEDEKKTWGIWNNQFLLFNNLAFGAIVLILSKEMLSFKNEPWIIQAIYGPAPLYFGLFISLVLMICFPNTMKAFVKNARCICSMVFTLAICFFISALVKGLLHGSILLVSGILYGISLIGAGAFIQPKIQGTRYIKTLANSQAFGKIGTVVSLCFAGFCIDNNFSPMHLLLFFSCLGAMSALYLFFYGAKLEQKKETVQQVL
jgi:MFS family permease